uniref:Uncharacterized protein n=1 Tax=Cyprinus carpio TaxID=7962 RepID=A0A8C1YM69_CYPCA
MQLYGYVFIIVYTYRLRCQPVTQNHAFNVYSPLKCASAICFVQHLFSRFFRSCGSHWLDLFAILAIQVYQDKYVSRYVVHLSWNDARQTTSVCVRLPPVMVKVTFCTSFEDFFEDVLTKGAQHGGLSWKGPSMHADEPQRDVSPRQVKVIHFSSGETLTEDDDGEEEEAQHQLHQAPSVSDPGTWTWKDYSRFWGTQILRKSLLFCDFLGEKMAGLLGLNAAKYQYAVDQYQREHKNEAEGEVLSASTSVNDEEIINLSKIASKHKQYGATNVQDLPQQTLEETLRYKGEQNEGYSSNE